MKINGELQLGSELYKPRLGFRKCYKSKLTFDHFLSLNIQKSSEEKRKLTQTECPARNSTLFSSIKDHILLGHFVGASFVFHIKKDLCMLHNGNQSVKSHTFMTITRFH